MLGFRRKPCLAFPRSHSQPGRSPTHLLELQVDELQPVGVNLVQVIAAAPWPIRLGALAKFGAARGHLGRGAFQRREDPRKSRGGGVMRGRTLSLPPLLGLEASGELASPAEDLVRLGSKQCPHFTPFLCFLLPPAHPAVSDDYEQAGRKTKGCGQSGG